MTASALSNAESGANTNKESKMQKLKMTIEHIPAIAWGPKSNRLFIAVHGNKSHKEDDVIAVFAECAAAEGYQVISFDLAEHGERKSENVPLKVQSAIQDLKTVMSYAKDTADEVSLFACSIVAYFSLMAYKSAPLKQALFLSPLVDMERMIRNMMTWFDVSEEKMKNVREIATPIGETLYWDYYRYVKENPVTTWNNPTAILYGTKDDTVELDTIEAFANRFRADLKFMEQGEHYFHTSEQLAFFRQWCSDALIMRGENNV